MDKKLEEYKIFLKNEELSESTISTYLRISHDFMCFVGNEIENKLQVIAYKNSLSDKGHCISTMNLYIVAVNRYLSFCGLDEYKLKTKKCQRRASLENVINEQDYRKLLQYTLEKGDIKYYAIMKTLAYTGIRVSELRYITAENLKRGYVNVENKGKIREIIIPDTLIEILLNYCENVPISSGVIFRGNTEKPISRVAIWKKINRMAIKTGISKEKVHPHSFRHFFALCYMKTYSNIFELADLLGHSSLETTRIYASASIEDKRNRIEKLKMI